MLPHLVILFCISSFIVTHSLYRLIIFRLHKVANVFSPSRLKACFTSICLIRKPAGPPLPGCASFLTYTYIESQANRFQWSQRFRLNLIGESRWPKKWNLKIWKIRKFENLKIRKEDRRGFEPPTLGAVRSNTWRIRPLDHDAPPA